MVQNRIKNESIPVTNRGIWRGMPKYDFFVLQKKAVNFMIYIQMDTSRKTWGWQHLIVPL